MNLKSLFLLVVGCGALQAGDWPQFRGPRSNGVSDETALPTSLTNSLAWQAKLPGGGLSGPIIIGDHIFVTCSSGLEQQTLHVLCFNARDGKQIWERKFWATGRTMCHPKTSVAANTPASDGKHIVAMFSSSDVVCLDFEGNLIWFRGLGRDYPNASHSLGMTSSLLISGDVVIAQVENESESFTAGLDLKSGVNRWKLDRPRKANWTSPLKFKVGDKELVTLQSGDGITAIEPATGKMIWNYTNGTSSIPSSSLSDGVLYIPARGITALQLTTGSEPPKELWQGGQLRPGTASPVVLGAKIFALNDGGILTCGDTKSGERLWQLRLNGPFGATPVAAGNFLYCVNEKGVVQVVDTTKPEGEVVSEFDLAEKILCTPSIAGGAIYFRSDTRLWKFKKS